MRLIETPDWLFSKSGVQWLEQQVQCGMLDEEARLMMTSDLTLMNQLQEQIDRFDSWLAQDAWQDERVRLLMTMPGVDVTVAEALLAALGDITRFKTPQQAASYLGLVPSTRQSASKCYHGPITKQGNVQARWMLVQAAQQLGRHPGPLGNFFRRIKRRKNHNVAVVACARKLVIVAMHMLKNNEPYRYAQPATTEAKLRRLRVSVTGTRRRTGMPKGQKAMAKLPGGSRTVKSLDRVYDEENLPPRHEIPDGERKMLKEHECSEFADAISADRVVPRRSRQQTKQTT